MNNTVTLFSQQVKMARAVLKWTVRNLAEEADISPDTVIRAENGDKSVKNSAWRAIQYALEKAGIEFLENGGVILQTSLSEAVAASPGMPLGVRRIYAAVQKGNVVYQNIDSILNDTTRVVTIQNASKGATRRSWSGIPKISDEVSLTSKDSHHPIVVKVFWISNDKQTIKGEVRHGYYPQNTSKQLDVGALVEFSLKKINGIFIDENRWNP